MSPSDFVFAENGQVDVVQLNALYRLVGWKLLARIREHDVHWWRNGFLRALREAAPQGH